MTSIDIKNLKKQMLLEREIKKKNEGLEFGMEIIFKLRQEVYNILMNPQISTLLIDTREKDDYLKGSIRKSLNISKKGNLFKNK
jgi:hypothetical protein